ncbi:MAG: hypothetical protein H6745_32905 [Deltaproteobacteria bacterium]|nr:hypothetical protein [Deltaproteobacteria bacterium]
MALAALIVFVTHTSDPLRAAGRGVTFALDLAAASVFVAASSLWPALHVSPGGARRPSDGLALLRLLRGRDEIVDAAALALQFASRELLDGRRRAALATIEAGLREQSDHAPLHLLRGTVLLGEGELDAARAALIAARELLPEGDARRALAAGLLARADLLLDRPELAGEAAAAAEEAFAARPWSPGVAVSHAQIRILHGDVEAGRRRRPRARSRASTTTPRAPPRPAASPATSPAWAPSRRPRSSSQRPPTPTPAAPSSPRRAPRSPRPRSPGYQPQLPQPPRCSAFAAACIAFACGS